MIEGKWIKYDKNSDVTSLINSVKDVKANWRIKEPDNLDFTFNFNNGEVYIYYTADDSNNYTVPRMFIEVTRNGNGPRVALALGIDNNENIEYELLDVLKDKLDEIGDKKFLYNERIADIKFLNEIYNKNEKGLPLSVDEIKFLYEFDREIRYFGLSKDEKISDLRKARKGMHDMNTVFRTMDDYEGNLELNLASYSDGCIFPKHVRGNFVLKKLKNLLNCVLPEEVEGDIDFPNVKSMKYVLFGKRVIGSILVPSLLTTDHVVFSEHVGNDFKAHALQKISNTVLPRKVNVHVFLESLKEAHDSVWTEMTGGDVILYQFEGDNFISPSKFHSLELPLGCKVNTLPNYPSSQSESLEKLIMRKILK